MKQLFSLTVIFVFSAFLTSSFSTLSLHAISSVRKCLNICFLKKIPFNFTTRESDLYIERKNKDFTGEAELDETQTD